MTLSLEGSTRIKGRRAARRQAGIAHVWHSASATVSKAGRIGSTRGAKRAAGAIPAFYKMEPSDG